MSNALSPLILGRTRVLFANIEIMLRTFEPQAELFDMPLWKHAYHLLHSTDRWFINPARFEEPPFHTPGLSSLDERVFEPGLSREDLLAYCAAIREKVLAYIPGITDEQWAAQWSQKPEGCDFTRLELVLGQFRHVYAHMGNINAVTMQRTGKWPRVIGLDGEQSGDNFWE